MDMKQKNYALATTFQHFTNDMSIIDNHFSLPNPTAYLLISIGMRKLPQRAIDLGLIAQNDRPNELEIQLLSSHRHRQIQIQQHHAFDKPIKWEPADEEIRREFNYVENCEHHPIGQPLRIVTFISGFNGFDGDVSRIHKPDHIAD